MNGSSIPAYFDRKRVLTRIIGVVLLLAASPAILCLMILVRCTSRGPGLYRQIRTGKAGKEFNMYKVRTMYINAESVSGPQWATPGDSRVTPVGKILRLLHLDELPQLINVARGEMDLIGPRPERPQFVKWLTSEIPGYADRCRVLPGVTGLAQINLPPDETLDCVRKKLHLDCQYIRSAGFGLDIRILLCTFLRMLGIRHGRAVRLLGLEYYINSITSAKEAAATSSPKWSDAPAFRPMANVARDGAEVAVAVAVAGAATGDSGWSPNVATAVERRPKSSRPPR